MSDYEGTFDERRLRDRIAALEAENARLRAACVERAMNHAYLSRELARLPLPEMDERKERP